MGEAADFAVYSFDVFDTCVTRRHAYPRDLFYDLGLRLAPDGLDSRSTSAFARAFQRRRILAEKAAHRDVGPGCTANIREIYERFSPPRGLVCAVDSLVEAEVELERESIYAIPVMQARLDELRESGRRIAFVSDMYLPATLLEPILRTLGVIKGSERLYVSCDSRATKYKGDLYQVMLEGESVDASRVAHFGDNLDADIRSARQCGISAFHFTNAALTSRERMLAGRRLRRPMARSFLPALSRHVRLGMEARSTTEAAPADAAILGIIAPFLVSYVDWVLAQAIRSGLDRLYFVARDGEVLHRIAASLNPDTSPLDLRYLHASRRAWLAPSIGLDTNGWEHLLVTPGQSNTRGDILTRAGLDSHSQEQVWRLLSVPPAARRCDLRQEDAEAFVQSLRSSPEASRLLGEVAASHRSAAVAYLRQEGMFDGSRWALVDVGWSLNSQAALARILRYEGHPGMPFGYYLALTQRHRSADEAGHAEAFVNPAGNLFSKRRVIVEHCFTPATHSTTRAYRFDGKVAHPVFGAELRTPIELSYAARVQEIAVAMANAIKESTALLSAFRRHRGEILTNAEDFLRKPPRSDAAALADFGTVADLRHDREFVQPLCRPLALKDVFSMVAMTLSPRLSFSTPSYMWLEGSSAISRIHVRIPVSLLLKLDSLRHPRRNVP